MNKAHVLKTVLFTIYGKPIPLKRHRHTTHCTYNPQKQEQETIRILMQTYLNQYTSFSGEPFTGPLHATFKFYFKLPKTKKLREKKGLFHHQKPDLSNLIKTYEDCMNNILFKDDAQISKIDAIKCYTHEKERTEITITQIEQADIIATTLFREKKYESKLSENTKEKQKELFYPATRGSATLEPAKKAK